MNNQTSDNNKQIDRLMEGYMDVCHRAIHNNRRKYYARLAKKLGDMFTGDIHFAALVYDDMPDNIVGEYDVTYNIDKQKLKVNPGASKKVTFIWKVPLKYLKDVVEERTEWYVEQPLRLDLKWLTDRVESETKRFFQKPKWIVGFGLGLIISSAAIYFSQKRKTEYC